MNNNIATIQNNHDSSQPAIGSLVWYFGYDVFISYARKDGSDYAFELKRKLTDSGLRVFLDTNEIPDGSELPTLLTTALKRSSVLAVIVTPAGCKSTWVRKEAEIFSQGNRMLVPIIEKTEILEGLDNKPTTEGDAELTKLVANYTWIKDEGLATATPADETITRIDKSVGVMRRTRRLTLFWTLVSLLFAVIAALTFYFYVTAEENLAIVTSQQLAAEAELALSDGYDTAALLAIQSYKTRKTDQAKNALLRIASNPTPIKRFLRGHKSGVLAMQANNNSRTLVSGDTQGHIIHWNQSGESLATYQPRSNDPLLHIALSDSSIIAAAFQSSNIVIIKPDGATITLPPPQGVSKRDVSVAWSKHRLYAAYSGYGIISWSEENNVWRQHSIQASQLPITAIDISEDGDYLAASYGYKPKELNIKLFNIEQSGDLSLNRTIPLPFMTKQNRYGISTLALSTNGHYLALIDDEDVVRLFNLMNQSNETAAQCQHHNVGAAQVLFAGEDRYIYTASLDGSLKLSYWDQNDCQLIDSFSVNRSSLQSIAVLADTDHEKLFTGAGDFSLVEWDLSKPSFNGLTVGVQAGFPMDLQFNQRSSKLYLANNANGPANASVWEFNVSDSSLSITAVYPAPTPIAGISSDNNSGDLIILGKDGLFQADAKSKGFKSPYSLLEQTDNAYWQLSTDKEQKRFAMMSIFGDVTVWDRNQGIIFEKKQTKEIPLNRSIALSDDGRFLAVASGEGNMASGTNANFDDGRVFVFDLSKPDAPPQALTAGKLGVQALTFDSMNRLYTGSKDGVVQQWNIIDSPATPIFSYEGSKGGIQTLSVNSQGSLLAAGTNAGNYVYLWEVENGFLMRGLRSNLEREVTAITFDDLSRLYAADKSGRVTRWEVDYTRLEQQLCRAVARPFEGQEMQLYALEEAAYCWDSIR